MNQLLNLVTLQNLKGNRTQITIIVGGLVNFLVQVGILKMTPDQLQATNTFLAWLVGLFFVEKVNSLKEPK